jgi:Ca2+-transporting ATPase
MSIVYPETKIFLDQAGIDPFQGLSPVQVEESRRKFGSNEIELPPPEPWWKNLLEKFKENPIPILLAAAGISIVLSVIQGHFPVEGVAILIAVALAVGVGFINEYKSGIEYEKLKVSRIDIPITVTRSGKEVHVQVKDIVVGDIVHLQTGSKVPADSLVIHSESMYLDQSRFNGESVPASKSIDDVKLYGGTDVVAGTGLAVVQRVGNDSEWGRIAKALVTEEQEKTPLEERLDKLTELINKVGTLAAFAIFFALTFNLLATVYLFNQQPLTPLGEAFTFGLNPATFQEFVSFFIIAVTIVVVAVPEGLPMAVNVSLALSMQKIAKDNNLVRKLAATETIGSANVILSDKTGTLTENKMTVSQIYLAGRRYMSDQANSLASHPQYHLLELSAAANSTAHLIEKDGRQVPDGNSTEGALLSWISNQGSDYRLLREQITPLKRVPFDSESKRMTSVIKDDGRILVLVKGAPERVIPLCSTVLHDGAVTTIDLHDSAIETELQHKTSQAMRTLALAYKQLPGPDFRPDDLTGDLTLLALIGISDPMRQDVPEAIRIARRAGIEVKMVTGDNVETATVLGQRLGLIEHDSVIMTGDQFRKLEDSDVTNVLPRLRILARAEPLDKLRLVNLLKNQRQVVAVTGDGTNDAPALKSADVGLAMGLSGTEVAKEASDIVLLDDNFFSIVKAVRWGRALYENIQKFIQFQLTINYSALLTAFLSPFLNIFLVPLTSIRLLDVPLTVPQLLWVNLIMDTLAVLALCLEPPSDDTMERRPIGRSEPFITRVMWGNILGMGTYFTIMLLVLMATNFLGADTTVPREFSSMVFTTYVFFQVFNLFNARALYSTRSVFAGLSLRSNFLKVVLMIVVVQVLLTTFGGEIFNTAPLPLSLWIKIILLTSTALIFGEIVRQVRLARRRSEGQALAMASVNP